jgi:histidine triad (HIT) family protein
MTSDCLFCRLLRVDLPGYRVYEDDRFTVLLTIFPINPGHLMVVINEHIESFYNVEDDLYTALMLLVKRMALVIKQVFTPLQVVMETSGIGNRHVHIHVLPVYGLYDRVPQETLEQQAAQPASDEDLTRVLRQLRQSLAMQPHD